MNYLHYSWDDFSNDSKIVFGKISQTFDPDIIVGIKRGGTCFATVLSYLLGKPVHFIESKDNLCLFKEKILLVDDICDTGNTFYNLTKNAKNYKTASLFYNVKQNFKVDYFARRIDRDYDKFWVVFPWEMNT